MAGGHGRERHDLRPGEPLAVRPFALWRVLSPDADPPKPGPLPSGSTEAEIADIYLALGQRGIDPRRADDLELFEIACIFGHHRPNEEDDGTEAAEEFDPIRYRVAVVEAEKRGEPPPPLPAAARKALVRRPEAAGSVARRNGVGS